VTCEGYKDLMMGYLDDELDEDERRRFEQHIGECERCRRELESFKKLKAITDEVSLVEPEERLWQDYWSSIYNRIERGVGWVLLSVSAIVLLICGGFKLIEQIIRDPEIGFLLKAGLLVLIAGLAVLFVSVLRERVYFWRRERYRNVRR